MAVYIGLCSILGQKIEALSRYCQIFFPLTPRPPPTLPSDRDQKGQIDPPA